MDLKNLRNSKDEKKSVIVPPSSTLSSQNTQTIQN